MEEVVLEAQMATVVVLAVVAMILAGVVDSEAADLEVEAVVAVLEVEASRVEVEDLVAVEEDLEVVAATENLAAVSKFIQN